MPMAMPVKMISAHIRRVSLGRWCATLDASVYPVERKSAGAADADLEASPRLGAAPLAPLRSAFRALASDRLEKELEILLPVVVGDLVARLDRLDRAQDDLAANDVGFGVGTAGMIGVAGDVAAARTVHGPAAVDLVEVARPARLEPRRLRRADAAPRVFDDEGAFRDLRGGEQAEPGRAAPDAVGLVRAHYRVAALAARFARQRGARRRARFRASVRRARSRVAAPAARFARQRGCAHHHRSSRPFGARARHREPRLHRHRLAQGREAWAAFERQALDFPQLVLGRVARDADADRHLLEC